ncbi:hypothetical protein N8T08_000924 [Aspergillus melleus]|uniref:Uncharacterized protein n=1 Tax=Aspergillus melleus TaxID=138277 RepID=A0ACC3BAW8_9EURO|nr:hypothetical protein N8T08_000924 [Aspergillus melleus]
MASHDANQPKSVTHEQSTVKTILLITTVLMSIFLVALDRTIISTAIPQITDEFNSLSDVGWYGSAYTLASCSFQLLLGKIYAFYPIKSVLVACVLLFEIGSAVCGAAPSSAAFIAGRAIAGVGAAGIFSGSIMCIVYAVPLEKRAQIQGLFGSIFGIASIVGPLIGGAFTSNVTWRWCFYINLPFGGVAVAIIVLCLQVPDRDSTKLAWKNKLSQLDALGTVVLISCIWNNGRIIALLTLMGALAIAFIAVQILLPKTATIPPRIFKQRSIVAGCWTTICVGASSYIYTYFLPIWFQSITGVSAMESGIRLLPLMLAMVLASIVGGLATQKAGYYTPFAIGGSWIMAIGSGLLTTLQVDTSEAKWVGYQILYGFGMGLSFQAPNLAAQTVLPAVDVPIGSSLMFFGQLLGATIFISVGENVLDNQLVSRLSGMPGFNPSFVTSGGATSLLDLLPESLRGTALVAYNEALRQVFVVGLVISCLTMLGTAGLEWKSMLAKAKDQRSDNETVEGTTQKLDKEAV